MYIHQGSHTAITGGGERYREEKNMNKDICVRCGEGVVNIRVGAIIIKDNKVRSIITAMIITILWAGASKLEKLPNKQ